MVIFLDSSIQVWDDIQKMCLSVSKMAVEAYHLCTVLHLENELHGDSNVEWPNFYNRNLFQPIVYKRRK